MSFVFLFALSVQQTANLNNHKNGGKSSPSVENEKKKNKIKTEQNKSGKIQFYAFNSRYNRSPWMEWQTIGVDCMKTDLNEIQTDVRIEYNSRARWISTDYWVICNLCRICDVSTSFCIYLYFIFIRSRFAAATWIALSQQRYDNIDHILSTSKFSRREYPNIDFLNGKLFAVHWPIYGNFWWTVSYASIEFGGYQSKP